MNSKLLILNPNNQGNKEGSTIISVGNNYDL